MGFKEALFYERLAPTLRQFRIPDVYVVQRDDRDLSFIMIMEDLVRAGCAVPDGTWGIAPDSAARALEELAALHVRYEDPARRAADVPWASPASARPAPGIGLLRFGLDNHRDKMTSAVERTAEIYVDHHAALIELWASGPGPATVVHGDTHTGNLFVDAGRTGFLDWGVINVTTPLRDAGYFLTMAMQPDDRRAHEVDLLKHYLAARAGPRRRRDQLRRCVAGAPLARALHRAGRVSDPHVPRRRTTETQGVRRGPFTACRSGARRPRITRRTARRHRPAINRPIVLLNDQFRLECRSRLRERRTLDAHRVRSVRGRLAAAKNPQGGGSAGRIRAVLRG